MKKIITLLIIGSIYCLNSSNIQAQVGINEDGSQPDASSLLDVKSTTKGILIPRMTTTQRTAISSPATGLMVFDNTTTSFWFYNGSAWTEIKAGGVTLLTDADSDTKIQVEESADDDKIRFDLGGSERLLIEQSTTGGTLINFPNNNFNIFLGQDAGRTTNGLFNNFIGFEAGRFNTTGANNVFNGYKSGFSNITGFNNVFNGYMSGYSNTTGNNNVFNGYQAGYNNTTGTGNIFYGFQAGLFNTTGVDNVFSGNNAGYSNTTGNINTFNGAYAGYSNTTGGGNAFNGYKTGYSNTTGNINTFNGTKAGYSTTTGGGNVFSGHEAGYLNTTGNYSVFIGYKSGYNETGSNKLYIENSNSATPLIYGDFANDTVKIHGTLGIKNAYTFPIVDGTVGQVLQTNGAGNIAWGSQTILQDADNDTKIQVEESADEDKIRFDLGGSEGMRIEKTTGNYTQIEFPSNNNNIFLGEGSGDQSSGTNNLMIGTDAGQSNIGGSFNIYLGGNAGGANQNGGNNVMIGYAAGNSGSGGRNTYIGNTAGNNNGGDNNTFLGYDAGISSNGSNNIFLGYQAGKSVNGSDKLYIENSNSTTPLIYGDFANDTVKIHGTLGIKNAYTFPIVDGTVGQVLQTNGAGNIAWASQTILQDADNDTKIQVEENADEDKIRFDLGGSERMRIEKAATNFTQIEFPNNNDNILIGGATGESITTGKDNIFMGREAGRFNITGNNNIYLGRYAGQQNTTGSSNTIIGDNAGESSNGNNNVYLGKDAGSNSYGSGNTSLGTGSGYIIRNGSNNTYVGYNAAYENDGGSNNTYLGYEAGEIGDGSNNVFLGYQAAYNEQGSNKLYIENSNSTTPLIYGDFANDTVKIHGTLGIKNAYTFPIVDGTVGQVLQTNGAGNIAWGSPTILQDADNDTKIQVEENADEDKIRFDLGGSERLVIEQSTSGATLINLPNNNFNTFFGQDAGRITNGQNNSFIGFEAGYFNTTGLNNVFNGYRSGYSNTTGLNNVFNGYRSGYSNTTGSGNIFYGYEAGISNTIGVDNVFSGNKAGYSNTTGNINSFNGAYAGYSNTTGGGNVFNGYKTGYSNTIGNINTFNGVKAGYSNTTGGGNVFNGHEAGYLNTTGNYSVFIGYKSGYNETGSNKLYIENSHSATPLIYGDFANDTVKIHGTLGIKNAYTFPIVDGTIGQVLQTDGAGNTAWATPIPNTDNQKTDVFQLNGTNLELSIENDGIATQSIDLSILNATKTIIADADSDTKIQVEGSADEDKIRFDLGSSERLVIEQSSAGGTLINLPNNNFNTFFGQNAGQATNGQYNSFIGYQTGYSNTTGYNNTFAGYKAGYSNATGYNNTFNGVQAGLNNTTGNYNTFNGVSAGNNNTTGNNNTFNGFQAGLNNTTGDNNTFNGFQAGYANTTGVSNTFNGYQAGLNNTTGVSNTLNGFQAGLNNTTGSNNTFNGLQAGYANTTGVRNTFNGVQTGLNNTTGNNNTFNGFQTGLNNTTGNNNTFNGYQAGLNNTTGYNNTFNGVNAGNLNTTGFSNTFNGYQAGFYNTTGGNNAFNGVQTGLNNTTGNNNTFDGFQAGFSNTTGNNNTFNGYQAGLNNTTGYNNTFNGYEAGLNNTTGNSNIFIGHQSGHNETGSNKLYIENSNSPTPLIYGEFDNDLVKVNGSFTSTGILYPNAGVNLPNSFAPDATYIGTAGNFISFAHVGISEDFLGYANNNFYFRDSPNGGDNAQPSVYAASFPTYSSRRWKHNIQNMDNAISIIQQLQGVTYTWNEDHGGFEDFGFIAEEVNKVLPQIAKKGKDGQVDGVEYGKITPYLVEAMKGQQIQIQDLEQEKEQLKAKNAQYEVQLQAVLQRLEALEANQTVSKN